MADEVNLGTLVAHIALDSSDLKEGAEQSQQSLQQLNQALDNTADSTEKLEKNGNNLNKVFSSITVAVGNLISQGINMLVASLGNLARDIIQTGEQFTASMSEVQAISGATADELKQLEETARLYGATTKFSATEAADALKYMALAGWDVEQSTSALGGILDLAAASGMELAKASDMVTDYLSAFGMAADQSAYFADLLTYAQGNSNTSAEQLGEAYKNCAANLNAAGQDVETVTSLLEAMANQGRKGSEAGTAMAAIMRDITAKMENGKIKIGETSVAVKDAEGDFRDLTDIMTDVEKATNGMRSAQQQAALSATFTSDSLNGINLVLNEGMEKVSGYEEALRNSTGSAANAAKTMSDNLSGDIKTLQSALDELRLKIFDSAETPLRNIVQAITEKGIPAIERLMENIDKLIPIVAAAAGAMASYRAALAIESIINGLKSGFAQLAARITALTAAESAETVATEGATAAQVGLNTAMAANPIGLVVGAIGALIAGLTALSMTTQQATDASDKLTESLRSAKDAADMQVESAAGEAEVINTLGERYESLRQKHGKTKADYMELSILAEQLAEKLGISIDQIRSESGEYQNLTDKIKETTQAMVQQAQVQAAQEMLKQATMARMEALKQVHDMEQELEKEGALYWDEEAKMWVESKDAPLEKIQALHQLRDAYHEADESVEYYTDQLNETNAAIAENADSTEKLGTRTTSTSAASASSVEIVNQKLSENKKRQEEINKEIDKYQQKIDAIPKNQDGSYTDRNWQKVQQYAKTIGELQGEYNKLTNENKEFEKVTESSTQKLTRLNGELLATQQEISNLRKEKNAANALGDTAKVEELTGKIAALQTKETQLRNEIKETKEELQKQSKAIDTLKKEMSDLAGVYDTLNKGQKLDLDTLLDLVDKYPEYAAQLLAAADNADEQKKAVEALFEAKRQEYILTQQAAIDNIKASNEETETIIKNHERLIESYRNLIFGAYDPNVSTSDLLNAISGITEAENAIKELQKTLADNQIDLDKYQARIDAVKNISIDDFKSSGNNKNKSGSDKVTWTTSGGGIQATGDSYSSANMAWMSKMKSLGRLTTQQEIARLEELQKRTDNTADDIYNIEKALYDARKKLAEEEEKRNTDKLNKELNAIEHKRSLDKLSTDEEIKRLQTVLDTYNLTAAEREKVQEKLYAAQKRRDEEVKKANTDKLNRYLDAIAHEKAMGQLSLESEIASYKKILDEFTLTADQRKSIEEKLYAAQQKQKEQALQKEYDRIDKLAAKGKLSTKQEIAQLEEIANKYELTTEEKLALEDKLYEKKQQLRQEEIAALDKLGNAVITALKNKYQQQKELEEQRLDDSIQNWKNWEDETVASIQGQIDALDELKNAHDEENQRQEYENKRQALELQAAYEKDDYNRQQIQKQIAALDKEENERLFNVQIEEQKKALQDQADNIRKISADNQERLQKQKETISKEYDERMTDTALQGEARKIVLQSSQEELISLINDYAGDYEMLGKSIGERIYDGMASKTDDIVSYVDKIAKKTDNEKERADKARDLERFSSDSDNFTSTLADKFQSAVSGFERTLNQISANAASRKQQLATTANAAADQYYQIQQKYYNSTQNQNTVSKPVSINVTANFNNKVDSPVEVRRQLEELSQRLAKEITSM